MVRFCLYSDIMSDHVKFELTFTKVGTIYDACINSTHTVMAEIILVSYQCPDNLSVQMCIDLTTCKTDRKLSDDRLLS